MRIYVDTASLAEIEEWNEHPWVSGFTTNPTLMRGNCQSTSGRGGMDWAKTLVSLTDKPISIDGPKEVWSLAPNVWRKTCHTHSDIGRAPFKQHLNATAICRAEQARTWRDRLIDQDIISVFAGRIMDTGRDPQPVIDAAKATGAQVLWASVREPYNIVQAEHSGCDIVTVPPTILRKWLDWHGKPLEVVAAETIAQFEKDSEGLWDGAQL